MSEIGAQRRVDTLVEMRARKGFGVADDQEEAMRGTPVRMLYAVRS